METVHTRILINTENSSLTQLRKTNLGLRVGLRFGLRKGQDYEQDSHKELRYMGKK